MSDDTPQRITIEDIETRLRIACRDIAAYWDEMLPGIKARTTGTIGRSAQVSDLIREHVLYVRTETIATLNGWARIIIEERDLPGRVNGSDAQAMARLIDAHADWLARHEAGLDAAEEIHEWSRRVYGVARPYIREDMEFLGECECGQRVDAPYDAQLVECPACGATRNRQDYREKAHDVLRGFTYTPDDAVRVGEIVGVAVKRNTINKWHERRDIAPAGVTRAGQNLYRWADIEVLATRTGRKARPKLGHLTQRHQLSATVAPS